MAAQRSHNNATEHANCVFINIDWKASRMYHTLNVNLRKLNDTITVVVRTMKPAIIMLCEVGESKHQLNQQQMEQIEDEVKSSWASAATEGVSLRALWEQGAPYMTVYNSNVIECSEHRIIRDAYNSDGDGPRSAQTFVCKLPCGESIDAVNVHAPSGTVRLKTWQRKQLLRNLLQSSSGESSGVNIGSSNFLIGGDMNTGSHAMSQLLQGVRTDGYLHTQERIHERPIPRHGDLCIAGGIKTETLSMTAPHYDPMHDPYGVCWSATAQPLASGNATGQPVPVVAAQMDKPEPRTGRLGRVGKLPQQRLSPTGYATEQSVPAVAAQTPSSSSGWSDSQQCKHPKLPKSA